MQPSQNLTWGGYASEILQNHKCDILLLTSKDSPEGTHGALTIGKKHNATKHNRTEQIRDLRGQDTVLRKPLVQALLQQISEAEIRGRLAGRLERAYREPTGLVFRARGGAC